MGEAKRKRGRPHVPLRGDPDRYALALYHAMRHAPGSEKRSERDISRFVAWLAKSLTLNEKGSEFHWPETIWPSKLTSPQEPAFAKTLRRKMPTASDDLLWLMHVSAAWHAALYGSPPVESLDVPPGHLRDYSTAQARCALANESEWFKRVLRSIIDNRHGLAPHPLLTSAALRP